MRSGCLINWLNNLDPKFLNLTYRCSTRNVFRYQQGRELHQVHLCPLYQFQMLPQVSTQLQRKKGPDYKQIRIQMDRLVPQHWKKRN